MTYISTESNIRCTQVKAMTPDQEREIRDTTQYRARQIALGRDLDRKQYMPYRLVNGIPFDNTNIRSNEYLQDSGMCLLDFDFDQKDSPQNRYDLVWKRIKPHLKDWHILHFERSLSGGCHATVRMPEGLTRKQVIRLFELRLQLPIDHCYDLARACFLVPNEYVYHTTPEYY